MTDKERLEEIEKNLDPLGYGMGGHFISVNDIYWLVKCAKEQAERVRELENHIDHLYDNNVHLKGDYRLQEQNKRYREALEAIAYFDDKEEGEATTRIDAKYIARKALEDEE